MMSDRSYRALLSRLAALRRRAIFLELATSLVLALAGGLGAMWVWVALEFLFYLEPPVRTGLGIGIGLLVAGLLIFYLARHLPPFLSRRRFGLYVERRYPALQERLISVLELWDNPRARELYSADLLAATAASAEAALERLEGKTLFDLRPLIGYARYLGLIGFLFLSTVWLSEGMAASLHRCAHPLTAFPRQARTRIAVIPGDLEVIEGEDALVRIYFSGKRPRFARLLQREEKASSWQSEELVVDQADSLLYTFSQIKRPFAYQVQAGDGASAVYRVEVIDPPGVQRLRLRYHYPAYSGLPVRLEEESGDIHALAGTRVDFEIAASKPLEAAALVLDDTLRIPARVEGNWAYAGLEVQQSGRYHVELFDSRKVSNRDPIHYAIEVIEDAPPQVSIAVPGRDADLPENLQVLLVVEATDDFGLSALKLVFHINEREEERYPLRCPPGRQVNLEHLWDLSALELLPEDRIYYRVEAFDNDQVSGPKQSSSREYVLRFPSLYELYEEATQRQEETQSQLAELAEEGRSLGQYLEKTRRELLRTEELSWEKRKELEATLAREGERARAVEELSQVLQQTLEKLRENGLSSAELLEKIAQIRDLMSQVLTPELREALEAVQQALDQADPQSLAEALREFNENQKAFQERLERTLALLEQVRAEQRLEGVVRQAGDLAQRQIQIDQAIEEGETGERLQRQEGSLRQDAERLQQELKSLSQSLEPFSQQTAARLATQAEAMEQRNLSGRMLQMIEELQREAHLQARRLGAGLEEDLGELAEGLRDLQGEFVAEQKKALLGTFRQAMGDLIHLSQKQETLGETLRQQPVAPSGLAEEELALMQGVGQVVEQIAAVARRTLSLEPAVMVTLGYALRRMQEAAQELAASEGLRATEQQAAAMVYLNEAVLQLRQSLNNLAQARMPSSFGEAMQKLLGLSEQQAQLNQATQQSLALGQQAGQSGRNQISRLVAQQQRILEALQELERAVRGYRGAEQRLEAIEKEMKEVLEDLQRQRLEPRTLAKQQHLLQRMLDASRSIYSQEEDEEKRRSETGQDLPYAGPTWLPKGLGQSYSQLREAMRQALEGPYPREYLPLIRQYYEQLYQDATGGQEERP